MPIDALPIPHGEHPPPPRPEFVDDPMVALPIPHAEQQYLREQIRLGVTAPGGGLGNDPLGISQLGGGELRVTFGAAATRSLTIASVGVRSLTPTVTSGS